MALRETLETIRSVPDPKDEENAKFQIIAPILGDLGWNPARQEILYEHPVGGKAKGWVDIALKGPNRLVALIEAKAPKVNLAGHVEQVLGYAFFEGVDICVLTNGLEWWLYLPREDGPPDERRFTTLLIKRDGIEQLVDTFETFLGKDNLVKGQAKKRAKQVLESKHQATTLNLELPRVWQSMLDGPDDELVELVRQRTYEKVKLRPKREQIAEVIRCVPAPSIVPQEKGNPHLSSTSSKPKPIGFRLWDCQYEIKDWKNALVQTVEKLHQRHGQKFINLLLELRTSTKDKNPYASYNRSKLRKAMKIPSTDVYLETDLNSQIVLNRIKELIEYMGYSSTELEKIYE